MVKDFVVVRDLDTTYLIPHEIRTNSEHAIGRDTNHDTFAILLYYREEESPSIYLST